MNDTSFKSGFIHTVRVRFADTDAMGMVYHGRYFEWFEAARTEMMRVHGMSYQEMTRRGVAAPVIEVTCRYRIPIRYDDRIRIHTVLEEVSRTRIRLRYRILGEDDEPILAEGTSLHCFIDGEGRPIRAPDDIVAYLKKTMKERGDQSDAE